MSLLSGKTVVADECRDTTTVAEVKGKIMASVGVTDEIVVLMVGQRQLEDAQNLREAGIWRTREASMLIQPR